MRKYETIFVIDSLLKSEEIDNIISKYERFISANGGQIEAIERWGKKRLAYEIKKRQYGYYVLIRFDGLPTMIKPLEREYRLNESLLRFKTLLMPKLALKHIAKQANKEAAATEAPQVSEPVSAPETEEPTPEAEGAEQTAAPEEAATSEQAPASESETAADAVDVSQKAAEETQAEETKAEEESEEKKE